MVPLLKVATVSLLVALSGLVHATAQIPDKIYIDGEEYALNTNPLDRYLEERKWERPKEALISSANWRGYIAHWKIDGDCLLLEDVTIRIEGAEYGSTVKKSIMAALFPSQSSVLADWYSGALIVPQGKVTRYVHMGYGSSYERYQIFRIAAGKVTEHLSLNGEEFERYKTVKFEEFTQTDEFKKAHQDLRDNAAELTEKQLLDFMRSFFAERYLAL